MLIKLHVPAEQRVAVARVLKRAYDSWNVSGHGDWWVLNTAAAAAEGGTARGIAGARELPLFVLHDEPPEEMVVPVVPIGDLDTMSNELDLVNGVELDAPPAAFAPEPADDEELTPGVADERLPALALVADGDGVAAVAGTILLSEPPVFRPGPDWPALKAAIEEWVQDLLR